MITLIKQKILLLFLGLYLTSPIVFSADWFLVNTENTEEELFVDRDSIEQLRNHSVKAAFKFYTVGKTNEYIRMNVVFRCNDKSQTLQAIRMYSLARNIDKNIIYQDDEQTTNRIVSGTRNESVYNYVCKK